MTEIDILKQSLNVSLGMLFVTVFLSVCTVTISAITMAFQRSHNRKSVKPLCNIVRYTDDSGGGIKIINAGLGPMIVSSVAVEGDDPKGIDAILPAGCELDRQMEVNDSHVIPAGSEDVLFHYRFTAKQNRISDPAAVGDAVGRYLSVEYKDIYDHKYEKKVRYMNLTG